MGEFSKEEAEELKEHLNSMFPDISDDKVGDALFGDIDDFRLLQQIAIYGNRESYIGGCRK